jgi:Flp pilus assembly pilin Flp
MTSILGRLRRFCRRNRAATSVEYAVALALILALCLPAISSLGGALVRSFQNAGGAFQTGATGSSTGSSTLSSGGAMKPVAPTGG